MANRLRAGEAHDAISATLGIDKAHGRRKCIDIANALGLPQPRSTLELFHEEVARRCEEGESIGEIANATGKSASYISDVRRALGFPSPRCFRLTEAEKAQIDDLLSKGMADKAIARKTGCSARTVAKRRQQSTDLMAVTPASCSCGRPLRHPGRCLLSADFLSDVRERLIDGALVSEIAVELGQPVTTLRRYTKPIVSELAASGVACRCGKSIGHRGVCTGISIRTRRPASPDRSRRPALPPRLKPAIARQILKRISARQSAGSIASEFGVAPRTVWKLIDVWRARLRDPEHGRCRCGRQAYHSGGCLKYRGDFVDQRLRAVIAARVMSGETTRQIAEALQLAPLTVARHSLEAREQRLANGQVCACGREIGHQYLCSATYDVAGGQRGRRPFEPALESRATQALLSGRLLDELATDLGVTVTGLRKLRQSLSPEQAAQRARAVRRRRKLTTVDGGEAMMTRVQAAVSRGIDAAVRDDVVGEIWLAVMEGRIEEGDIRRAARKLTSAALAQWQNTFGPRSLDEKLADNGAATVVDTVADDTAISQLDEIEIGTAGA